MSEDVSPHAIFFPGMLPMENSLRYLDLSVKWQAAHVHDYEEHRGMLSGTNFVQLFLHPSFNL
jgi:hypothetical protein